MRRPVHQTFHTGGTPTPVAVGAGTWTAQVRQKSEVWKQPRYRQPGAGLWLRGSLEQPCTGSADTIQLCTTAHPHPLLTEIAWEMCLLNSSGDS